MRFYDEVFSDKINLAVLLLIIASTTLPLGAQQSGKPGIRRVNPATLSAPRGYTHVVVVSGGRTVYVSGQVPLDKDGKLVGAGDFAAQTRQVFENLKAALAAAQATFADLVKINIYVTDASQIDKFRQVRNEYLASEPPASTFVEVKALFRPEVMIEIDAIAVLARDRANQPIP